ncbi:AAA family ATPase [Aureimonas altamirensis]|uniref:AAA family ATPase n=1 Tax=Aureimonas altamirensis TaxID=370622 RepID=UPI002036F8F2|nr:AAA family ATPase [Aureimonas altamirensis]MCM2505502.1 AAA family ATPase [Aureimonas altamirensis]
MKQEVTIVTGISGVGKSFLLNEVSRSNPFFIVSAGRTIMEQISDLTEKEVIYDDIRLLDLNENQELFQRGFERVRSQVADNLVVDAHVVVDTPEGLRHIDTTVFKKLGAKLMVFLEQEPRKIVENRLRDPLRNRPLRDAETLRHQQSEAKEHARKIAYELGIPFTSLLCASPDDLSRVLEAAGR